MRNEGGNLTAVSIYLSILIGLKTYFWFLQFFFGFALLFPNARLFLTGHLTSHLPSSSRQFVAARVTRARAWQWRSSRATGQCHHPPSMGDGCAPMRFCFLARRCDRRATAPRPRPSHATTAIATPHRRSARIFLAKQVRCAMCMCSSGSTHHATTTTDDRRRCHGWPLWPFARLPAATGGCG